MAWRRPGDKPLSEPMVYMHICITGLQWINSACSYPFADHSVIQAIEVSQTKQTSRINTTQTAYILAIDG